MDDADVRGERGHVALQLLDRAGLNSDRRRAEPAALDGDRAAAGTEVPHQVPDPRSEAGQDEGAYLGLGEHPVPVSEGSIRQCPRPGHVPAGQPAHARRHLPAAIDDEQDVGLGPDLLRSSRRRGPGAPLVALSELLGDEELPGGVEQGSAQLGRSGPRTREHRDLGVRPAGVDGPAGRAPVGADDQRVVPRHPGPGEGQLHRRRRWAYDELVGREDLPQAAHGTEETWVTTGDDDAVAVQLPQRGDSRADVGPGRGDRAFGGLGQVAFGSDDQLGSGQQLGVGRRAVVAQDRDHAATHCGWVAATTRRPVKSTIATSAASAPSVKRCRTSATCVQSRSPARRRTPAASHTS